MDIHSPGVSSFFRKGQLLFLILIAATLPIKAVQVNSIAILCLCGLWLIEKIMNREVIRAFTDVRFWALGSLFFVFLFSVLWAQNKPLAFSHLETRFSLFAIPVVILSSDRLARRDINIVLIAFLVMCLVTSAMCIIGTVYTNLSNGIPYNEANSWYYSAIPLTEKYGFHPSYFSIYCSFCIFFLVDLYKNKAIRLGVLIGLGLYLAIFQLFLASRIGVLAFIMVSVVTLLYEFHAKGKLRLGLLYSILLLLLVGIGVFSSGGLKEKFFAMVNYRVHQYNQAFKVDNRLTQWQSALAVFEDNIWLGTSVGDLQAELVKEYDKRGFKVGYENRYNTHNLLLETACSTGLLGILSLACLFAFSFYTGIRYTDVLYLQFLLLFTMLAFVEAPFSVQKGVVYFAFFNTLLLCRNYPEKQPTSLTT